MPAINNRKMYARAHRAEVTDWRTIPIQAQRIAGDVSRQSNRMTTTARFKTSQSYV